MNAPPGTAEATGPSKPSGLTDDTPLAHWYRHERAARIYDGPDEVHKWVVARQVLRDFRERGPQGFQA